jgi:TrmH family RNA methyltransferase
VYKQISSIQNPFIKEILQLQEKSRARKKSGVFVIEGKREILLAVKGDYTLIKLLLCETIFDRNELNQYGIATENIIKISTQVYQKIAHRSSTEGIIAIAKSNTLSLSTIKLGNHPLILVAEAPEKPGNIGALLRTADAANVDAVLIADPKTDMYNPNIIRSSVGCLFTNQIATGTTTEIIAFLRERQVAIFCAALQASTVYTTQDFTKASAIVVGTEATGLSKEWLTHATQHIRIPMQGQIDSLNVSASAAILIFEAKRQRNFE